MTHFPDRALYAALPNALNAFAAAYETCSSRSGRTTAMLAALEPDDCVVTRTLHEASLLRYQLRRAGKETVAVIVWEPNGGPVSENIRRRIGGPGRVVFDHNWMAAYWENVIRDGSTRFWQLHEELNPTESEESKPCPKLF